MNRNECEANGIIGQTVWHPTISVFQHQDWSYWPEALTHRFHPKIFEGAQPYGTKITDENKIHQTIFRFIFSKIHQSDSRLKPLTLEATEKSLQFYPLNQR